MFLFFEAQSNDQIVTAVNGGGGDLIASVELAKGFESFAVTGGVFAYGGYPDTDALYQQQAVALDRRKREAILHKIQQIIVERVVYAPIWQLAFINGTGPRVAESGFGLIARFPYTAPYEDITLKAS